MCRLEKLRKNGFQIKVTHYRNYGLFQVLSGDSLVPPEKLALLVDVARHEIPREYHRYVLPRGGQTVVELIAPNGKEVVGKSQCSEDDNFCKRYGLNEALNRALQTLRRT